MNETINIAVDKFKSELAQMKSISTSGDTIPIEVFFLFADSVVGTLDKINEANKELWKELDEYKEKGNQVTNNRT